MHSLRRAVLRAARSATVVVPKSQVPTLRFAAAGSPAKAPIFAIPASRFFGVSAIRSNENEEAKLTEEASARTDETAAASTAAATQSTPPTESSHAPGEMEFRREPNGVYGVFVWNIPYRSTEREMYDTFSRFGKVHSLNIGRDARGLSRGFGFVYYMTVEEAKAAVAQADGAFWQGRRIGAKPKNPNDGERQAGAAGGGGGGGGGGSGVARQKTPPSPSLYVGNIPYEASDTELNEVFSNLPKVLDVRVAVDKATGWPRGFAHADFPDIESATAAMEKLSNVTIQGRSLRVDYCESKKNTNFVPAETPGPSDKVLG